MSSSSEGTVDGEQTAHFKRLKQEGREHLRAGKVKEALGCYQKAYKLIPDEKLGEKIGKMKEYLESEAENGGEEGDMVEVGNGFYLYVGIEKKLYAYQREGLLWMWKLFLKKRGGVLGDDMGLGKTIQVISFLSGMFDADLIKSVLLIMPVSLISNWKKEFETWAPGIKVFDFHTGSKQEKERNLMRVQRRGGVLITSYGMLQNNSDRLGEGEGKKFTWCYIVLDEGHKIKNPTKTTKAVYEIPAKNRLVLTGTAIQNNLRELWALFNFTHQGTLLGSLGTFKGQYENPINRAREKDATAGERLLGVEVAQALRKKIEPFFLRRTKAEVLEDKENNDPDRKPFAPKLVFNAKKNDLVVWTYLSHLQKKIYSEFLMSDEVANILMTKKSPLVQLTILKKICDHPRLLSRRACMQLGMHENMTREEIEEFLDNDESNKMDITNVSDETLLEESGKMMFVLHLLIELKRKGHRALFFSQSRKILDIIQRILINRGFKVTRLDGTITKMVDRDRLVCQFQGTAHHEVFLLTTQVGGVGLTLTAADRVIIYDPSWNPATDAQAVDRVYRIGQLKNVVVYRLVTCSTVEEKIYRRQIFKDSIIKQTTGKQRDPTRYFTKQELRELFTLEDPTYSQTQVQLEEMHSHDRKTDASLEEHIKFLQQNNIFGVSHHDLMFSTEEEGKPEEFVPGELEAVRRRVEQAEHLVNVEAEMFLSEIQRTENYTVPMNIAVKGKQPGPSRPRSPNAFPIVVPDDDEVRPALKHEDDGAPSGSINESIDVDSLDSINQTLGNLTVKGSSNGESIIVEGSDDELFPGESNDAITSSYVIDESDEELSRNASSDHDDTYDEDVKGTPKDGLVTVSKVKSELIPLAGEAASPVACRLESNGVKSELPIPAKVLKEETPSHIKQEGNDEGSYESTSKTLQLPKALKEEIPFMKQEENDTQRKTCASAAKASRHRSLVEYATTADASPSCQPNREDICRNLFEEEARESAEGSPSPPKVFARSGGEPQPCMKKCQYGPNLTPSPSRQSVKHHARSPYMFRPDSGKEAPVGSPLTVGSHPPSPFLGTPRAPNGDLSKPLEKERISHIHTENGAGELHRTTSTPVWTPLSPRPLTPRRITPLHVSSSSDKKPCSFAGLVASPFQKAMATSLELSPERQNPAEATVISDEEDSPVIAAKKTRVKRVLSDNEDCRVASGSATMGQSIVISDDEDGPIKVHRRSAAAGVILSDDDDSTQRSTSSEDEMISQNEEEGWASISQSFSSIE